MARSKKTPQDGAAHKQFKRLKKNVTVDILKDGELKANVADGDEAFRWLHEHLTSSIDWAVRYEGWEVRSHPTIQFYPCVMDNLTGKICLRVAPLMEHDEAVAFLKAKHYEAWLKCEAIPQNHDHPHFKGMEVWTKNTSRAYAVYLEIRRVLHG